MGDYKTFNEFKSAQRMIQENCFITGLGDKLCKKYNMENRYYYPEVNNHFSIEDFPLNRLSVKNNNEEEVVSWRNNIMTVSKHAEECVYNFNNWTVSGNGCDTLGLFNSKVDFNCDYQVDIQDFAILLSHWGQSNNLNDYKNQKCSATKRLDLAETGSSQNKIDVNDLGVLFSCWGNPEQDQCLADE